MENHSAIELQIIEGTPTFIFHKDKIDLGKACLQGLDLLRQMAVIQEDFEYAAKVRDEIKHRKHKVV